MNSKIKIVIPAEKFAEYKKLGAEKSAIDRQQKAIMNEWVAAGIIPEPSEATSGQYVIVNGNQDEIGKLTVYHFPGSVTEPGWRKKLS